VANVINAPDFNTAYQQLVSIGLALGLGLLVGLEREWADNKPLGLRSFAVISVAGALCALIGDEYEWALPAGLLALGAILATRAISRDMEGLTTLLASLTVFLLGAAVVAGDRLPAVALAGTITLLLHFKRPLHHWIERLGPDDFNIIARFVLIALVILPLLPDENYGPYKIFNPFEIWLMVVLIVGMSLAGFLAFRLLGDRAGSWLAGALGGMVSSTVTAVSYSGMVKEGHLSGKAATLIILVASTVVYARMLIELSVVAPSLLQPMVGPVITLSVLMVALSGFVFWRTTSQESTDAGKQGNPARFKTAITFALLYTGILWIVAASRDYLGDSALYLVAFISGLTDVDALTLSVGRLYARDDVGADTAWRAIFLASIANLVCKTGIAMFLGDSELRRWIFALGGISVCGGLAILGLWPSTS
jgi:uncharacterized membrane protein (DUF4010 family)